MFKSKTKHENYWELIWVLAKTDFKLRYQGSFLGYIWALLKPFLLFLVLNFVFSSLFSPRNNGMPFYSLQLLTSIMIFNFFSEGTSSGLGSLLKKASLVTKIFVPRWAIILSSTIHSALVFLTNLIIIVIFFIYYHYFPQFLSILVFFFFIFLTYWLILIFSFFTAPLFLKFRDLSQIWDVILTVMFYAAPIVYPLSLLPSNFHLFILLNPIAFIIHFTKIALTENRYPEGIQIFLFVLSLFILFLLSFYFYRKMEKKVAEWI